MMARPSDQALAVPATPLRVDGPSGFDPSRCRHVTWSHDDGPLLVRMDGTIKWLSWRERFMHWIGRWSLDDISRRPDGFSKLVYYPPHDIWLSLPAGDAIAIEADRPGREARPGAKHESAAIAQTEPNDPGRRG